jgi:hypothetical protein
MSNSGNKKILWIAIAVMIIYLYTTSAYMAAPMMEQMPMEMPMQMPMPYEMPMEMPMPYEMPMEMPMDTMSSGYVRAAQKYNKYGVPISPYRKGTSTYEMNKMSGSNYLDGSSITTPISSTGDGTRKNQLYDIRPQPAIGLGDPLKDYTTNPNPILNNGLY